MSPGLRSLRITLLTIAGLVLALLLFGWLALPSIIQSQAEKFIAEKTGHRLSMNRPEFNPMRLSLHLSGLHLAQPDGEALLSLNDLTVEVSAAGILRGVIAVDSLRIDGVEATLNLLQDGRLNWSGLIDAFAGKDAPSGSSPPKLEIHRFVLSGAKLNFADKQISPNFSARVEPIDWELTDISTLPDDKGRYKLTARTSFGARVDVHGEATLNPLSVKGNVSVAEVNLAALAPYFKDQLPIAPPLGIAGLSADYRVAFSGGKLELNLEHLAAKLSDLKLHGKKLSDPAIAMGVIEAKEGSFDLAKKSVALGQLVISGTRLELQPGKAGAGGPLELGSFSLEDVRVNLADHQATLGRVVLKNGRVRAVRSALGRIDLQDDIRAAAQVVAVKRENKPEAANAVADPVWHYRVGKIDLAEFNTQFRDEAVTPPAELALNDIALSLEGVTEDLKASVPLHAAMNVKGGGNFEATGKIVPADPAADIHLKFSGLRLAQAQPYLSRVANLKLADGVVSAEGQLICNTRGADYKGGLSVRNLRLNEAETGNLFLSWKFLGSRSIEVTGKDLNIGELVLSGLDTKLIIDKDKTVSIKRVLKQAATDATPADSAPSTPATAFKAAQPFTFNIDRLLVKGSEMDFADYSLSLPFGTRIHDLQGVVSGISTQSGVPGQIELDGQVDEYGLARATGQAEFLNPTDFMDIKVVFSNIEMTRLTPYSATFAGRKIDSGKLSLNLEYKIHQHQLQGENQVIMDQLTLGDRVESPDAKNLPLDLAIALLQDSDGRIDLGLPVSGNLDDPQFSYGGIVWKALTNVLTKMVTAPFRALGSMFGGSEKFENIVFEAGNSQLTPPEREKLQRLSGVLAKRPKLALELHGTYAESDRAALQDRQLRRSVLEKSGQHVEGANDPGPISLHQAPIRAALETMYADAFGKGYLSALKEASRLANPEPHEENTRGKPGLPAPGSGSQQQVLGEKEMADLKGADLYSVLYARLRNRITVDEAQLLALATARGEYTATALKAAGAPADRVTVMTAEKAETDGEEVPLKLVPGAATRPAVSAVSGVPAN